MFITLYILNHNYGEYIRKAIYSALNQNFSDYEIIILDDGSSDDSREILGKFERNKRIRILYQENKGLMPSINRAWKEAKGKYVLRLDADDTLRHDALSTLANHAKLHPTADWIFPGFYTTDKQGKIFKQENRSRSAYYIGRDEDPPHGACSLIRKEALIKVGGYNEMVACRDGLDLFLKFRDKPYILSVPEHLFFYRRHDKNLTLNSERIRLAEEKLNKINSDKLLCM